MITDGSYYCGRCGDDRVVCSLCVGMEPALVKAKDNSPSYEEMKEMFLQERSIRLSASKRQGF